MTDKDRLLAYFRNSNGRLISCSELVEGQYYGTKKIIEYSGRITDARKEIGCTCGKDKQSCTASEHIINERTNWYRYVSEAKPVVEQPISQKLISLQVENRLQKYRMMWTKAKNEKNVKEMDRIALMARTCALALHTKPTQPVPVETESNLFKAAREVLL